MYLSLTLKYKLTIKLNIILYIPGILLNISVATAPGCKTLAVTPVSSNLADNSVVNSILYSLELAYIDWSAITRDNFWGNVFMSSTFVLAKLAEIDETLTILLGADFFILSETTIVKDESSN